MTKKSKTSCLLLHGFTSHRSSLEAVIPELDKRKIPWHYPILAGHGSNPKDLTDKTWDHWQQDAEMGLKYLLQTNDRVVIIALSMGTLLALELAEKYPEKVAGLVLLSPALHFKLKLAKYTNTISRFVNRFPNPSTAKFSSHKYAKHDKGYLWFPTSAFKQYWLRTQHFDSVLEKIHQPVRIIHSKKDLVANPSGALHIYSTIPSKKKDMIWLSESGHEVLLDAEVKTVLKSIFSFKLFN
ncbi:alpha/beta hydrolase [Patescibacteria group bacterium]